MKRLKRLAGEPCDDGRQCPAVFAVTDDEDMYIVQGWEVTDSELLAELRLPPGESAVRLPASLMEVIRNA